MATRMPTIAARLTRVWLRMAAPPTRTATACWIATTFARAKQVLHRRAARSSISIRTRTACSLPCDQCPTELGIKPSGCPVRDFDGDGIPDDKDKCPKEPETKNGFEDQDGCPDTVPEAVKKFTGVVQGIFFDQNKATIRAQSSPVLGKAAKVFAQYPSVNIEISGHTSSEGDEAFNQQLSLDRAQAVKDWLIKAGTPADRIRIRGAGPSEPIADNKTNAGREKNRRIEFKLLME